MPEFAVPYRLTLRGALLIEAETADEARDKAEDGEWDDPTFKDRAEHVDWEVIGTVKEA